MLVIAEVGRPQSESQDAIGLCGLAYGAASESTGLRKSSGLGNLAGDNSHRWFCEQELDAGDPVSS